MLAGCGEDFEGDDEGAADPSPSAGQTAEAGAPDLSRVNAEFQEYSPEAEAVTYDKEAVPVGSTAGVHVTKDGAETDFHLAVSGLKPEETYGAHVHTMACGEDPADAGPHYQNDPAPTKTSHDPAYVNPDNEVWLDFTTNADGAGTSNADVEWHPRKGEAGSIVIHSEHTKAEPGVAGEAGTRLACVNILI
nr:superoxide dismutase family protein [Streptomonospora sp. PA3]